MKDINSIKISKRDMEKLNRIHQKLTVEFPQGKASESEVLTSIKESGIKVIPKGALKALKQEQIVFVLGEDIYLHPINNEKGGEKVQIEDKLSSAEEKIAKAILKSFEPGFKAGRAPTQIAFTNCLKVLTPKINGEVTAEFAVKKMLKTKYLELNKEGKIVLGPKGREYLSL